MNRRQVPPPTQATKADAYRFILGLLMLVVGIAILVRTSAAGVGTQPALLMSIAFIGFGAYRVYTGIVRYRMYREMKDKA